MDPFELESSLVQILENYQRCGLARINRVDLSDELSHAVAALTTSEMAEVAQKTSISESKTVEESVSQGTLKPLASVAPAASQPVPPMASQPDTWTLPVLEDSERTQRLEVLANEAKSCRQCSNIVDFRQQTVFGTGPSNPAVCFIGEAPGADEDRQGVPFVGKAGQLLSKIISAMKLKREEVYILNALKCRPPQNRTPVPEEIECCRHFAETQLEVLQPKFIVCLGAVAVRSLLQSSLSIGKLRGRFHDYRGARVVVTYHPSYLLRNESAKRMVWEDMQMLMRELGIAT